MTKNILVITGSHRKGGNSEKMADAFITGAQTAGHRLTKYVTADQNIKGCQACDRCFSKGQACVIQDDFNALAPLVEQADTVVFATPVYWFTFPANLKLALDKFHAFLVAGKGLKGKESALLVCAASPTEAYFDGLVTTYRQIVAYLGWTDKGYVAIPGVFAKDDVLKTDGLERAEALGASLS